MDYKSINFEFFRVLPVILFFISVAFALAFKSFTWSIMVLGFVLNGVIWNFVNPYIKKRYPEISKRPQQSQCYFFYQKTLTDAGGMPSGHSQSTAFFATWLVIMAIYHRLPLPAIIATVIISIWLTVGMMISRVHVYECHTTLQAAIGSTVGITSALLLSLILLLK